MDKTSTYPETISIMEYLDKVANTVNFVFRQNYIDESEQDIKGAEDLRLVFAS
ncbi:MAG: hypothetical protein ACK5LL_16225 [Suipraeoptans sp.]